MGPATVDESVWAESKWPIGTTESAKNGFTGGVPAEPATSATSVVPGDEESSEELQLTAAIIVATNTAPNSRVRSIETPIPHRHPRGLCLSSKLSIK